MTMEAFLFTAVMMVGILGFVFYYGKKNHKTMKETAAKQQEKKDRKALGLSDVSDSSYFAPFSGGYEKLDRYKRVPHEVDEEFYVAYEAPPTFGKDSWQAEAANYPLAYGAVVQAHNSLYEESNEELGGMGMVLVTPVNSSHAYDGEWIQEIAKRTQGLRDSVNVPVEARKVVECMRSQEGLFCELLPKSITDGEIVYCWVAHQVVHRDFPERKIPAHRIVPVFVVEPEVNSINSFHMIPAKAYQ